MAKAETCGCNHEHHELTEEIYNHMLPDEKFGNLGDFYKIMGDPTRLKILWVLLKQELCVCDICAALGMTKSAVSHQLATLRGANLVKNRRDGKTIYYSIYDEHVREVFELGLEHINE